MKGITITPLIKNLISLATTAAKERAKLAKWGDIVNGKWIWVWAHPSGEIEIRKNRRVFKFGAGELV